MARVRVPLSRPLSRRRALVLAAAPFVASGIARAADDWPTKPVKLHQRLPARRADRHAVAASSAPSLRELTGQQFIVDNKAGSGGNIGTDAIAKSAPDGYTIGLYTIASQSIAPTLYAKLAFDVEKDFTADRDAVVGAQHADGAARAAGEDRARADRARPRQIPANYTFASSGAGTTPHITGEMFKQMTGVNLLHVPYKGSAPAYQDLLANQVDMMWDNIPGPARPDARRQGARRGGDLEGAPSRGARHPDHGRDPARASRSPRGAASAGRPACRRRWSRSARRSPRRRSTARG